jgi:hypothetical protein
MPHFTSQFVHVSLSTINITVSMEGDDITLTEDVIINLVKMNVSVPPTWSYGLAGVGWTCPLKHLNAERETSPYFAWVTYLVVKIPHCHCIWVFESWDNVDNIALEDSLIDFDVARALNPLGVVKPRDRFRLLSSTPGVFPAVVK